MPKKRLTFDQKVKIKDAWADKQDKIYQKRIAKLKKQEDRKYEDINKIKDKINALEQEGHEKYRKFVEKLRDR